MGQNLSLAFSYIRGNPAQSPSEEQHELETRERASKLDRESAQEANPKIEREEDSDTTHQPDHSNSSSDKPKQSDEEDRSQDLTEGTGEDGDSSSDDEIQLILEKRDIVPELVRWTPSSSEQGSTEIVDDTESSESASASCSYSGDPTDDTEDELLEESNVVIPPRVVDMEAAGAFEDDAEPIVLDLKDLLGDYYEEPEDAKDLETPLLELVDPPSDSWLKDFATHLADIVFLGDGTGVRKFYKWKQAQNPVWLTHPDTRKFARHMVDWVIQYKRDHFLHETASESETDEETTEEEEPRQERDVEEENAQSTDVEAEKMAKSATTEDKEHHQGEEEEVKSAAVEEEEIAKSATTEPETENVEENPKREAQHPPVESDQTIVDAPGEYEIPLVKCSASPLEESATMPEGDDIAYDDEIHKGDWTVVSDNDEEKNSSSGTQEDEEDHKKDEEKKLVEEENSDATEETSDDEGEESSSISQAEDEQEKLNEPQARAVGDGDEALVGLDTSTTEEETTSGSASSEETSEDFTSSEETTSESDTISEEESEDTTGSSSSSSD